MAQRPAQAVRQALLAKGMVPDENHHEMYRKSIEGVTHLVTRISHNSKPIGDTLGLLMANQLCLQLKEFWELVDCPLSERDWDAKTKERCSGDGNPFLRR